MPLYGERECISARETEKDVCAKRVERAWQRRLLISHVWGQRGSRDREGFTLISTVFAIPSSHLKSDKFSSLSSKCIYFFQTTVYV